MNLEKIIKYSLPVFALLIISRSIEEISFIYYAVPVMCVFFIVLMFISPKANVQSHDKPENQGTDIRHQASGIKHPSSLSLRRTGLPSLLFLLPGLWFLLTSLWSSYPEVSALRAMYFILISLGCISAGVLWIRYSGRNIFEFLLPANIIVVLLCLFSLITNIPSDSWTAGHGKGFMGFFGHQNLLASALLFTLPAVFSKLWRPKNIKHHLPLKAYRLKLSANYLLLAYNLLLLTLTYSRSAIVAMIFGLIVFLILNKNWKVLSYSFIVAVILTSIFYFTPSLNNLADKILKKDFPEVYSSRMWMWEPSYRAALNGGLIGLGYGVSDPNEKVGGAGDHYEGDRFVREKGNSTLALIEETGLIGLILFMLPLIVMIVKNKIKLHSKTSLLTTQYSILTAALAAFLLHAQFEAWWVGVGSVQLPLFFIYFGLIVQCSKFNSSRLESY